MSLVAIFVLQTIHVEIVIFSFLYIFFKIRTLHWYYIDSLKGRYKGNYNNYKKIEKLSIDLS